NQLVLDHFSPLLTKIASGLELQGSMNGQVDCRWGEIASDEKEGATKEKTAAQEDLLVEANVQLNQFSATGGPLGTDRLQLAQPNLACKLSGSNGIYVLKQVGLDSEVATVALDGQVVLDTGMFTGEGASSSASIANQTFNLNGRVDLARLANMLPTTLHLHDQTTVNSGELTLNVSAAPGENVAPLASGRPPIVWNAIVQTSNIVAMRHGTQLAWHQPITLTLRAREADRVDVVVDELLCTSDFLRITAEGHREEFTAGANFDLSQLMAKLGAIVDLGGLQMRGKGLANLNWRRVENQETTLLESATPGVKEGFTLHSACQIQGLEIGMAQASIQDLVPVGNPVTPNSNTLFKRPWTEPFVIVTLSTAGRMPAKGPVSLAGGDVRITSNAEQIVATLTKPVEEVSAETVWPIRIDGQGQLARWIDRVHAMGYMTDWRSQGAYNARIVGSYQTEAMKFENVAIQINNFHMLGPNLNINEPQVNLNLTGYYDGSKSRLLITQADCQTSSGTKLTAENFIYGTPENQPMELAGTLGVEGDLARMQAWLTGERNWFYQGHLKGIANLKQVKDVIVGRVEANVQHLMATQKNGYKFYEPDLIVTADGSYNGTSRMIELTDAQLTSSVLSGQVKGNVLVANDPIETDLVGSIDCNMKRLSALMVPYLGPNVEFQGNSKSPVKLQGPMTLAQMHAETGIGWDMANVYGFDLGKGQLDFTLDKGLLSTAPIQMKVNQGQVNLNPQLRVAPGEMQLEVPAGTIVDNVQINKQMCENGLKYIAPVLADVAQADGRFSLAINQCRIPIDNPSKGQLVGQLTIHDMAISSGPLIQQFGPVLQRMTSAKLQKESVVPFKMVNGKIYHENLELVFPEITIKTKGYVGLDQSMNLVAEMPVPQKWINQTGGSIKPALRGQKVVLRIGGTLSKPQLNQRAMQQEMQRFIGNAAANVIEKEGRKFIDEQLNRLFQPTR
ncbi:MAG: hypothetical protein PVH19_12980, partial [Planctomycetia bacterium]